MDTKNPKKCNGSAAFVVYINVRKMEREGNMNMNARCRTWLPCLFLLVCALFCTGQAAAYDSSNLTIPANATAITYGVSGKGRALMAYKFGSGKNVMVLGYEIHGFEDNYDRDGGALVYAAGQMMNQLSNNIALLDDYDWTVYVLPSMNPDGLLDGTTNNGPGRLTTTYLTSSGTLSSAHGIDMNRSFPTAWVKRTDARNYNGTILWPAGNPRHWRSSCRT